MIPEYIELENFGCVKSLSLDLLSSQNKSTGVVGPNGTGKSTVFSDAPLWVLFGVTRGDADSCVRVPEDSDSNEKEVGKLSARVALVFSHNGFRWKVVRTRTRKGKTTLSLFRLDGAVWSDLSEKSVRETERVISDLLRMDASTFRATSMMVQGESDAFCSAAPSARRSVLASLCGLDVYADLLAKARSMRKCSEEAVALETEAEGLCGNDREATEALRLLELRRDDAVRTMEKSASSGQRLLEQKDRLSGKLNDLQNEIGRLAEQDKALIEIRSELEKTGEELKRKESEGHALSARLESLREESAKLSSDKERIVTDLARLEASSISIGAIENRLVVLNENEKKIKSEGAELGKKLEEIENLNRELKKLESEFESDMTKAESLSAEASGIRSELSGDIIEEDDPSGRIKATKVNVQEDCEIEERLERKWNASKTRLSECERVRSDLGTASAQRKAEISALERSAALLIDCGCRCIESTRETPCRFLEEATRAERELPEARKELRILERSCSDAVNALNDARSELENVERARTRFVRLREIKAMLSEIRARKQELETIRGRVRESESLKGRLESLRNEYRALSSERESIRRELNRTKEIERLCTQTKKERTDLERRELTVKSECSNLERLLMTARTEYGALRSRLEMLFEKKRELLLLHGDRSIEDMERTVADNIKRIRSELELINEAMAKADRERSAALSELGRIEAALETMTKNMAKAEELRKKALDLRSDAELYAQLEEAFGPDGIPQDVFDLVVPELSDRADAILSNLTDGKMSLEIVTSRELKDGRSVSALDIVVSDYDGARPYETFSGGERFRVDLAVRMALAEFLASRSGGKIEWVTLDEGLGSQDERHLGLVMESITKLAERYGTLFIITHVKDAIQYFDRIIDLGKEIKLSHMAKSGSDEKTGGSAF